VLDGSSTRFDYSVFTPALPRSDYLTLEADIFPDTLYTVTFSSPVRDPVFHLSSVMYRVAFPGLALSRLSGDTGFRVQADTVYASYGLDGPEPQADGTVQLLGTFTTVRFFAQFTLTDSDLFHMQLGATPVPLLSVATSESNLTLRWPMYATNFLLEATTSLSPPEAWAPVTNTVVTVGETFSVTVDYGLPRRFFRLRRPE